MKTPDQNRRVFLRTIGASAASLGLTANATGQEKEPDSGEISPTDILWRPRDDGEQQFYLDPLEGEKQYPNEPLFVGRASDIMLVRCTFVIVQRLR